MIGCFMEIFIRTKSGKVSWNQATKTAKAEFSLEDIIKKFKEIGE